MFRILAARRAATVSAPNTAGFSYARYSASDALYRGGDGVRQSEASGCLRDELSCAEPRELPFPAVPRNCALIKAAISRRWSSPAVIS